MKNKAQILDSRNYNIDLLKIFAMFLVVVLHITGMGGVIEGSLRLSTDISQKILNAVAGCCINLFSLCTGYLLCTKTVKIKRLFSLWFDVFFYSVVCFAAALVISKDTSMLSFPSLGFLFPICFSKYWYMSVYFAVYIFSPFFNRLIESLDKKQFSWMLICALTAFSVIPTVAGEDTFLIGGVSVGQSFVWITTMYFIGAYIKKYGLNIKRGILFAAAALSIMCNVIFTYIPEQFRSYGDKTFTLGDYSSITVVVASTAIFVLILGVKINVKPKIGKLIAAFASASLAVYLIHTHEVIFYKWIVGNFTWVGRYSAPVSVLVVIGISLAVTLGCSLIGIAQRKLFCLIGVNRFCEKLEYKMGKIKMYIEKRFI